jgi:hypothetical protein|tara:strand:+ start:66 stop:521 length:456 start_codon:yes stop_codon:yes gene_type:complete
LKLTIYIAILTFLILGCTNSKRNLIIVENDYEIDLTKLDSVRENLNGFWQSDYNERYLKEENILIVNFKSNIGTWEHVGYNKGLLSNSVSYYSCQPIANLIKVNDSIKIEFVGMGGSDTTKIEYLSKTKLILNEITYLKHKGYELLKQQEE